MKSKSELSGKSCSGQNPDGIRRKFKDGSERPKKSDRSK